MGEQNLYYVGTPVQPSYFVTWTDVVSMIAHLVSYLVKNKTLNIWQIKKAEPHAAKQFDSAFEKFFQVPAKPRARTTCLVCQLR